MKELLLTIKDPIGLHARPASKIVNVASKYTAKITLEADGKTANLKSIMNVLALGVKTNTKIKIKLDGEDESEASAALQAAFKENKLI